MDAFSRNSYENTLLTAMSSISLNEVTKTKSPTKVSEFTGGEETQIKKWVQEAYTSCVYENNELWLQHMRVNLVVFADRKDSLLIITAYKLSEPNKNLKIVIDDYPHNPITEIQKNTLIPAEYEGEFLAVLLPYLFKQTG